MKTNADSPATMAEIPSPHLPVTEIPQVNGTTNGIRNGVAAKSSTAPAVDDPFKLGTEFAYTPRKVKVFTIGAGFSGLIMAHKFQHRFPEMRDIVDHTIFESRSDVGGTWLANDYPGVQCDVPAHIYVSLTDCYPSRPL
jgi:NAD(P)-binding Rossmann-like domain